MTFVAARVARIDPLALLPVTRVAPHLELLGVVREALVAASACRMPRVGGYLLHVFAMAVGAQGELRGLEPKMMWLVATGTSDAGVLTVFRARVLVTGRASPRLGLGQPLRLLLRPLLRMGIVAADAAGAAPGMIGVHVFVAARAGGLWRCLHVVGLVTARAVGVGSDVSPAEHLHLLVAGAARDRRVLSELMGAMTSDAFGVPTRKDRAGWDQRLLARVTHSTGLHGVFRGRVLVLVAGLARLLRALALRGMAGVDA